VENAFQTLAFITKLVVFVLLRQIVQIIIALIKYAQLITLAFNVYSDQIVRAKTAQEIQDQIVRAQTAQEIHALQIWSITIVFYHLIAQMETA